MKNAVFMMKVLRQLCSELGKTINFTACYSDYIATLKDGKVAKKGTVEEIINEETLQEIYETNFDVKEINGSRISAYY